MPPEDRHPSLGRARRPGVDRASRGPRVKLGLISDIHGDPVALAMMRSVKQALDPRGILNPGKIFS